MKNSHYSMINKIVRQKKSNDEYIIDRQEIAKYIDLSEEDQEEKDMMLANFIASTILNYNGYRSVIKGHGVFIDEDALKSKLIAHALINNSRLDVKQRTAALQKLEAIAKNLPDDDASQYSFCSDDDGNLIIYEDITKEELIELIRAVNESNRMEA